MSKRESPSCIQVNASARVHKQINMAQYEQNSGTSGMKRRASSPVPDHSEAKRARLSHAAADPEPAAAPPAEPSHVGQPKLWARDRQALCETLPTFRSYQGALYHVGGQVKGVLLSGDTGLSHLSSDVIIFRAPGKSGVDVQGQKRQLKNHSWKDAAVKALVQTKQAQSIVFFHVSSGNSDLEIEIPHPICYIGAYWLTDVWAARLDETVSIWCKAQNVRLDELNWWDPKHLQKSLPAIMPAEVHEETCSVCGVKSPRRFDQAWLCLNDKCENFFKSPLGEIMNLANLHYDGNFLLQRHPSPPTTSTASDPIPQLLDSTDPLWWMKEDATRGLVCRDCGQCLPRVWFRGWKCDHCGFKLFPEMTPVTIRQLLGSTEEYIYESSVSALPTKVSSIGEWRVTTFTLDAENTISLFQANEAINTASGGSDQLFLSLQKDPKLELRRFALHNRAQREFLAAHYSQNFGMPYKYVVATESKPFSDAPDPVLAVKDRLTWATQQVVGTQHDAYNELLAVGYFSGNKMGFHDDGEKDLGPNVSSLSLGSDSTMSFRVKRKYHQGFTGASFTARNVLKDTHPIMPGSFLADERRRLATLDLSPSEHVAALEQAYSSHWDGLVAEHGARKATQLVQRATSPKVLVKIHLRHGDMVLMSGPRIQQYLEHEANGIAGLRFALTCREITPPQDMPDPDAYITVPDERRTRFDGLVHHSVAE